MRVSKRARWALVIVATAALVLAAAAAARTGSSYAKKPIIIGWAFDNKGPMQPFDTPALAAAQLEVAKFNKKGVDGRKIVIKTCKTQGDDKTTSKVCADKLISQDANVIFTTCDVDLASPVVQESLKHHLLTIAPCIGTDQMGPKRFGKPGKLAYQLRQRRAGRGLGDGRARVEERLEDRGPRDGHRDRLLQGRRDRIQGALPAARWEDQLRDVVSGSGARERLHELPQRCQRHRAASGQGDRHGDVGLVRRPAPVHHRPAHGWQQHPDPELVGGRRDVLAAQERARRSRTTGS